MGSEIDVAGEIRREIVLQDVVQSLPLQRGNVAKKPVLEMAVMDVLWESGGWMTPSEVRAQLPADRRGAYTTVMTVLVRLTQKKRVERERRGKAYSYRALQTRAEYAASRMEELLHAAGDRSIALSHFIENLSASERRELQRMLGEL